MRAGELVRRRFEKLRPFLDERQRRLLLGAEAPAIGRGGITVVAEVTGGAPRHRLPRGAGAGGR